MAGRGGGMTAATTSQAVWYLTRGTGAVSLVLLTTVTVLGIVNAVRWAPGGTPRFVLQRIHRNVSLLAVVFIVVHVATAVIDGFAPIRWIDAVVPFGSAYRPMWLGLGAVAFDLVIALVLTSLIRAQLGHGVWRAVHWAAYGSWAIAVFHALGAGTDARQPWLPALVVASLGAVVAAVVWRLAVGWRGWSPARVGLVIGAISVPAFLGAWFVAGPMQPGWAARAGTPRQLLASATQAVASHEQTTQAEAPIVLPARTSGAGVTRLQSLADGRARVVVTLRTQAPGPFSIRVVLNGERLDEGVAMSDGSVLLTPPGGAVPYRGSVTGLSGGNIAATLSDGHGDQIALTLALQISESGQTEGQVLIQKIAGGPTQA
jgi:sulfoxide reductase heme-binding subunit YedZ